MATTPAPLLLELLESQERSPEVPWSDNASKINTLLGPASAVRVPLTDGATIDTDASLGGYFSVTLGGNRAIANPTNLQDGHRLIYQLQQDGTGSRTVIWDSKFNFGTDVPLPTLSTSPNVSDFVMFIYNSAADKLYCLSAVKGY